MPSNFKQLVRERMAKTGESWQTAERHVRARGAPKAQLTPSPDYPVHAERLVPFFYSIRTLPTIDQAAVYAALRSSIRSFKHWEDEPLVEVQDVGNEMRHVATAPNGQALSWPLYGEVFNVDGTWVKLYAPWTLLPDNIPPEHLAPIGDMLRQALRGAREST